MLEHMQLPLFVVNCVLILLDASLGFFLAPRLMAGLEDADSAEAGVRATRNLLSGIVAVYMFFNCLGFFQGRSSYLLVVSGLVLIDLVLQGWLRSKSTTSHPEDEE